MVGLGDRYSALRLALQRAQPAVHCKQQRRLSGERGEHRSVQCARLREPGSGRAGLSKELCGRRHCGGNQAMAQPECVCLGGRSDDRSMCGRRLAGKLPIRQFRTQLRSRTALHKLRHLPDEDVSHQRGLKFRLDTQMFNAFNHANFALPSEVEAGVPGVSVPARFGTLESTISPPTGLLGVGLGGDSSPRMIAFQGRIEF